MVWKTSAPPATIRAMSSIRFLLILLLTVALDLSTPPPQHRTETTEEFEETLQAQRGRRAFRHVREATPPAVAQEQRARELHRPSLVPQTAARSVVTTAPVRKLPPSIAEPSLAPEDH